MQFGSLPKDVQEAVNLQVVRIKTQLGISSEILYLDELATLMGVDVKSLWNLRNRDSMPPIPVLKVGQKDAYWIFHVVMWLMHIPLSATPSAPLGSFTGARGRVPPVSGGDSNSMSAGGKAPMAEGVKKPRQARHTSASKQALLDKANQLFEAMERKRSGK